MTTDLRALQIFLAVVEHGGFGAAARALRLSQPTVSASVQGLERRLGLRLIARSPAGSRPTAVGTTVADWARDVVAAADRLETGAAALRERHDAHLRVSASMTIAEYLVPGWLTELRRRRPQATVTLRVRNSEDVAEDVLTGAADLGFVEGVHLRRGLRQRVIGVDELAVVVAAAHPWGRRRRPLEPPALVAGHLVLREPGSGTREAFEGALDRHRLTVRPVLELGSTAAIKSAVAAGTGAAVLSALAIADDVASGRLIRIAVAGLDLRRRLRMVWRDGTSLDGAAAELERVALRRSEAG
ncbi:LysR family transcriptional regulator [Micromonospora sp. NPDC005305]|uniref:LysR family transcriptional regulator n=1 Tax=Micromonospora sp. NPDC005305 TaxID=3156875 RepID=UPI0033AF2433